LASHPLTENSSPPDVAKENRALRKKVARLERSLQQLQRSREQGEFLLNKTIQDLQSSQAELQGRSQVLEQTLADLQATQSRLTMAEKMSALGILMAGVAHEINNPVSFIYGNINYAQEHMQDLLTLLAAYQGCYPEPLPPVQDCLEDIDVAFLTDDFPKLLKSMKMGAERIKDIVLSLRTFARTDEAAYKAVDLHEGLDSTLVILGHRLKANSTRAAIQIERQYSSIPLVECYAGPINQVFMNILSNAIDALDSTEQGLITVSTAFKEDQAIITMADNGPGIPETVLQKIFDPFFTTKPVGKGTGMGLSISYQIITEQHHGRLSCQSSPDGTQFTIRLPLKQNQATVSQQPSVRDALPER